jgi:hypothetical protein
MVRTIGETASDPCRDGRAHKFSVHGLAISPDGKLLASGSDDRTIKLWSLPDGTLVKTLKGHSGDVYSAVFHPDGKLLASGSPGNTKRFNSDGVLLDSGNEVKLWSLPDGALTKTLKGRSVAIRPDGKLLASGDATGSIYLWRLPDGERLVCLIDLAVSSDKVKGSTYTVMDKVTGLAVAYTLPCGSPLPPGATCTCNCVPGSIKTSPTKPVSDTRPCGAPLPPGAVCTCNCVPSAAPSPAVPWGGTTRGGGCSCNRVCTCMAVRCR